MARRNRKQGTINLIYRFDTDGFENRKSRLKIEINSREHFTVFGYQKNLLKVNSRWFSGEANILTYSIEELLGTKMRALYQRRKSRDLFDLWMGLKVCKAEPKQIVKSFQVYMEHQKVHVSRKEFLENFSLKMQNNNFIEDMQALLTEGVNYNLREAADLVIDQLIERIK